MTFRRWEPTTSMKPSGRDSLKFIGAGGAEITALSPRPGLRKRRLGHGVPALSFLSPFDCGLLFKSRLLVLILVRGVGGFVKNTQKPGIHDEVHEVAPHDLQQDLGGREADPREDRARAA